MNGLGGYTLAPDMTGGTLEGDGEPDALEGLGLDETVKAQAQLWLSKIQDSLDYTRKGGQLVDDTRAQTDLTVRLIQQLPSPVERYYYNSKVEPWRRELASLSNRLVNARNQLNNGFDKLREVLGGTAGLSLAPLVLFAIVAAAVAGAGILWNEVVNKTRQISADNAKLKAVLEGKLPPDALKKAYEPGFLDFLKGTTGLIAAGAVLFLLLKRR